MLHFAQPLLLSMLVTLAGAFLSDRLVHPRTWRSLAGLWLQGLVVVAIAGGILAVNGNMVVMTLVTVALIAALALVSNTKLRVLGEPLLFSDLALFKAVFRHPQFYLSALGAWSLAALLTGTAMVLGVFALCFVAEPKPHLVGLGLCAGSLGLLALSLSMVPWRTLARQPDATGDVAKLGLTATILLHWQRWRTTPDPPPCELGLPAAATSDLVIVVQCESFADPAELFDDLQLALPGLTTARQAAWRHGRLLVSGFGAYTMRTEFGVMFGRDEEALGFRRFDPYLSALGEVSHALPARLARSGWRSVFLHPHDLRFYGRDRILSAAGFTQLVGPEDFAPPSAGRYVTDWAVVDAIMARAERASGPHLLHAVTIENHGPWPVDRGQQQNPKSDTYLDLVRRGDAALSRLMLEIAALKRPSILLFYGDHRPSIPGAVTPGGDRHTPYVLLRFAADGTLLKGCERDLTPAQLHHELLLTITA